MTHSPTKPHQPPAGDAPAAGAAGRPLGAGRGTPPAPGLPNPRTEPADPHTPTNAGGAISPAPPAAGQPPAGEAGTPLAPAVPGPQAELAGPQAPVGAEGRAPEFAAGGGRELVELARRVGLRVGAGAGWPEGGEGGGPPVLAGFVGSSFSPLVAEVARRCLERRAGGKPVAGTGMVVVSALGDLAGAVRVAEAVDGGRKPGPLAFFQAVPNAVAGHVAARWGLRGPVVSVADPAAGMEVAALLIEDGDADEVLVVRVEQAATGGAHDLASAVLLSGRERP